VSVMSTRWFRDLSPEDKRTLGTPLKKGESPFDKLTVFRKSLGAETPDEAEVEFARIVGLPGFMEEMPPPPKRDRRGHPGTSTLAMEAAGLNTGGIPAWVHMKTQERFLDAMRTIKKNSPRQIDVKACARKVLGQKFLGGWRNPYYLDRSVPEKIVRIFAAAFAELSSRAGRLRKQNAPISQKLESRWSRWNDFAPILDELLPISLNFYLSSDHDPSFWHALLDNIDSHQAFLDQFNQSVEKKYGKNPDLGTWFLCYVANEDLLFSVRAFWDVPSRAHIYELMAERPDADRVYFDWGGALVKGDRETGLPLVVRDTRDIDASDLEQIEAAFGKLFRTGLPRVQPAGMDLSLPCYGDRQAALGGVPRSGQLGDRVVRG
jgi:hypothetical protein